MSSGVWQNSGGPRCIQCTVVSGSELQESSGINPVQPSWRRLVSTFAFWWSYFFVTLQLNDLYKGFSPWANIIFVV